jgi:HEPN domain-containing protein
LPSPEAEAAEALLRAAAEDEAVVRELVDNTRIADSVIGFHAQQAVEKLLKATLARRGLDYPFTHDIARLLDLVGRSSLPDELPLTATEDLTPWATELRYGGTPHSKLDRSALLGVVGAVRAWAESQVRAEPGSGEQPE